MCILVCNKVVFSKRVIKFMFYTLYFACVASCFSQIFRKIFTRRDKKLFSGYVSFRFYTRKISEFRYHFAVFRLSYLAEPFKKYQKRCSPTKGSTVSSEQYVSGFIFKIIFIQWCKQLKSVTAFFTFQLWSIWFYFLICTPYKDTK